MTSRTALRTRIAPTPSGFLHLGNAANALLVSWLAASHGGSVALRIDDVDAARSRPEYVQDVFDTLSWLGIDWDEGPRDRADFVARWSQGLRTGEYRAALEAARHSGMDLYACRCSRRDLAGPAAGGCPGGCRSAGHRLEPGHSALRVHVPPGTVVEVDGIPIDLATEVGDFVVWRRDDLPSYHLASVVDDERGAITTIVRGEDLRASSAAQRFLAVALQAHRFLATNILHHPLVNAADGAKLSKSQATNGQPLPRDQDTLDRAHQVARELGRTVGISPP